LQKRLVLLRQTIDARGDYSLHGRRNFERVPARFGGNAIGSDTATGKLPGNFLDEERILPGVAEDTGLERIEIGGRTEQIVEQGVS
jgi:hypothetical protein